MNLHSQPGNRLGDYCDGELYLNSELFKEDPCALQIQLYYDEVEVCNPIGSKAKKHKLGRPCWRVYTLAKFSQICAPLGLVYYMLGNLHPKFRSSLKSIQLLCVARYPIIIKYGIEEILQPIVKSIQELEKVKIMLVHQTELIFTLL